MARKPVSVYKRPMSRKGRFRYYIQIWDEATNSYVMHRSADSLVVELNLDPKQYPPTSRTGALLIGQEYLNRRHERPATDDPLYTEYCADFWDWDKSPYIRGKLARGQRIGREYVSHNAAYVKNYLYKAFPALKLSQVRTYMLEEFALSLKTTSGLGNSSINAILNAASLPLTEATRLGLIETNPAQGLRKLGTDTQEKGIPTEAEIRELFALPDLDPRIRCAILLGATCALRLGEVQALRMTNIGTSTLTVFESWGKLEGLKSTKTARVRVLPLPVQVRASLEQLAAINPHGPSGFLFYGLNPDAPLDIRALERGFYAALNRIGISEADRKERRLSFHSLRHWSNAMLRGSLSDAKLRLLTGHSTSAMTSHYDHVTETDMLELSHAQETRLLKYLKVPELDQK